MRPGRTWIPAAAFAAGVVAVIVLGEGPSSNPALRVGATPPRDASAAWQVSTTQRAAAELAGVPTALEATLGGGVTMSFVLVPGGTFTMGSPLSELHRYPDEDEHVVTIRRPFYLGVHEVTRAQFARFVEETRYRTDAERAGWGFGMNGESWECVEGASWRRPGFRQEGDHPVTLMSWHDADAFCRWLSARTGRRVRLPTEAEWERACRAGTTTRFCSGDDLDYSELAQYAWHGKNAWERGERYPHRVRTRDPNPWGLYDMRGNQWEWCFDRYRGSGACRNTGRTGATDGPTCGLRGGSFVVSPWYCRAALRARRSPTDRDIDHGFRCLMELPPSGSP